ncbi:MAG TPA: hypothetical protein VFA65_24605 [Bryobacteraceae bacterium]|nr:hypothetical protein [Bryobacteraceae bacterium]
MKQRQERLNPASEIVQKLGGEAKVSEITGAGLTAPYSWQYARGRGGTDGLIPQRHHVALLEYARTHKIDLKAEDFLPLSEEQRAAS